VRIPRKFGERTLHFNKIQEEKRKYILVCEGQVTEVQYFQGVIDNRITIGINPIIELLPVLRSIQQESHSHPKKILSLIEEHIEEYHSVKMLINKMIDYCAENGFVNNTDIYTLKSLEQDILYCFEEKFNLTPEDKIIDKSYIISELVKYIEDKLDLTKQVENIIEYIEEQEILYIKDKDYICLIIDRDKGSVKSDQYSEIIQKCEERGIRLFVSNPSFEFWLLLHSEKVFNYDSNKLLDNKKEGEKRYLEKVLSEVFEGYRKEKINVHRFIPHIKKAIVNEKKFCEDIRELEEKLGSNIGVLLEECILS